MRAITGIKLDSCRFMTPVHKNVRNVVNNVITSYRTSFKIDGQKFGTHFTLALIQQVLVQYIVPFHLICLMEVFALLHKVI